MKTKASSINIAKKKKKTKLKRRGRMINQYRMGVEQGDEEKKKGKKKVVVVIRSGKLTRASASSARAGSRPFCHTG